MKLHPGTADFLKSACGALSNMCQNSHNQALIAANGGIVCMLQVLKNHRSNTVLLPFTFDALASLIVGNQENGRKLSEAGAINAILSLMDDHIAHGDLVKSGCHALAILSDNRGEGAKIAQAGGVRVLLPILRHHPNQTDLHRVAAVVLLRMLQEAPVAVDMARNKGVPLMLNMLSEQMDEVETVAAGCHILYSITHADVLKGPPPIDLEEQLSMPEEPSNRRGKDKKSSGRRTRTLQANPTVLVDVLRKHTTRKDVARACVRSIINLSKFSSCLRAFTSANTLEPLLSAVVLHPSARDITEGALTMLKLVDQAKDDKLPSLPKSSVNGMLACMKARPGRERSVPQHLDNTFHVS